MAARKDADYEITIVRAVHDSENPFFMTRRATAQNRELSYAARGLLWYLLSRPDDWTVMISDLEQQCGRDKVYSLLKELQDAGHLTRNQARAEGGKFGKRGYTVHEVPRPRDAEPTQETDNQPLTEKPETAKPDAVSPVTDSPFTAPPHPANPPLQNTELVQKRDGTEDRKDTSPDGDVPRIASASAEPVPPREPAIDVLMDSIRTEPESPPVATLTEPPAPTPPVSAPPPAPPRDAEPTPAGDIFYVTADGAHYGPFTSYNAVKAEVSARGFKRVAVTQTRPDGELIAPDKPGRKTRKAKADGPRLEQPPADVKDAFALLCYNGTAITGASWARLIKAWNRLEKPPAEKFATFTRWWKACDWRGVKGQRPTPEQVVSEWDVAQNWDGATPVAATPYQQNYRSKAELDAERNRINVQKSIEKARELQANSAPKDVSNLLAWKAELEAKRGKS